MMSYVFRNQEGYLDVTAGKAVENAMKEPKSYKAGMLVKLKRKKDALGLLLKDHSNYFTMLILMDAKTEFSSNTVTHNDNEYFYDSGRVNYVYVDEITSVLGELEEEALDEVKKNLVEGLGLVRTSVTTTLADILPAAQEVPVIEPTQDVMMVVKEPRVYSEVEVQIQIAKLEAERDAYKNMCMQMMRVPA